MIRSKIHRGLQRRGNTKVDSDILLDQTGDMQLTVRAGTFVDAEGKEYTINSDTVYDLSSDPNYDKEVFIGLRNPSNPTVYKLEAAPPENESDRPDDHIHLLVGWKWLVIPAGASALPDFHTFTFIDNVGVREKPTGETVFFGRGEESGNEHEFTEIEHYAQRKGQGGVFFACPECGAVTRGKPCKECGSKDTVKVKDCE